MQACKNLDSVDTDIFGENTLICGLTLIRRDCRKAASQLSCNIMGGLLKHKSYPSVNFKWKHRVWGKSQMYLFASELPWARQLFVQLSVPKLYKFLHNPSRISSSDCCFPSSDHRGQSRGSSSQTGHRVPLPHVLGKSCDLLHFPPFHHCHGYGRLQQGFVLLLQSLTAEHTPQEAAEHFWRCNHRVFNWVSRDFNWVGRDFNWVRRDFNWVWLLTL